AGTAHNAIPTLKDPKFWTAEEKKTQRLIMRGSEYGEQDRKAAILYEYETFKATEGEQLLDTYLRYLQVFTTRRVLLRCDSTGDLYPVTAPSPIPHAYLVSQHTWHQRLGQPRSEVLRRLVSSNFIFCNKEKPFVLCHACQLGKHVRLSFVFRHKYLADGMLSRYKARLVANGSTQLERVDVAETFSLEFSMTYLGLLNYSLGIFVTRDSSGMFLSLKKYVVEILERAGMVNCNPSRTLDDTESKLGDTDDIVFIQLYIGVLQRQPTLSRFSVKAEYHGVTNVVAETCLLRNLLRELHTPLSFATLVYCDNISVVYLSSNPVQHHRTKHINIDISFVRDLVVAGQVRVLHVPSRYQYADIFTKVKISFDFNEPKDSSKTDKAAENGCTPKSLTLKIYHDGCFTPMPSRSYVGRQVSSVNVDDIDEFCLHDLKDMMAKYVKDYKIILVYVEHGSGIFVTPKKGVAIAVDNHLRKGPIEIDSRPDPASFVEAPIVVDCVDDPFEDLDEILGDYTNIGKHITEDEITRKRMVVHVGNSSTIDDVLDLEMLFETEGVGPVGKLKEVEVDADNESEEESDTEGDYTSGSDSEDSDYDPKHDEVFDDDDHIVEDVHVSMNNFSFTADPKHYLSIGDVEVHEYDPDVIDYDSFGSDLDDGIDSKRRTQLRELRRIGKQKIRLPISTTVRIDVQQEPNPESLTRTFIRVYVFLGALTQGFRACGREILGLDRCFILKEMLWNSAKATSVGEFNKKTGELKSFNSDVYDWLMKIPAEQWSKAYFLSRAKCDLLLNNICEVFNRQLVDGRDLPIITCLEYIEEYLMKRIVVVQKVIAKTFGPLTPSVTKIFDAIKKRLLSTLFNGMKWELTGIPFKYVVAAIYNMSENSAGVAIPEQWVHAAYILETLAHVYSFKVNPCNVREIWPVFKSRTVIIPPLYKPQVGRPPKKRKKSHDDIANESCSSGKLSRKGKSARCGKCRNVGHNKKGYMGQGGATQAGGSSARNVSSQAGARRAAGVRNVSG
nr:hypothetical protein [Tanacetum cinerariifolium]